MVPAPSAGPASAPSTAHAPVDGNSMDVDVPNDDDSMDVDDVHHDDDSMDVDSVRDDTDSMDVDVHDDGDSGELDILDSMEVDLEPADPVANDSGQREVDDSYSDAETEDDDDYDDGADMDTDTATKSKYPVEPFFLAWLHSQGTSHRAHAVIGSVLHSYIGAPLLRHAHSDDLHPRLLPPAASTDCPPPLHHFCSTHFQSSYIQVKRTFSSLLQASSQDGNWVGTGFCQEH